eukprot:scaffold78639_cov30-Tisochrysis_lutea.AAC.2
MAALAQVVSAPSVAYSALSSSVRCNKIACFTSATARLPTTALSKEGAPALAPLAGETGSDSCSPERGQELYQHAEAAGEHWHLFKSTRSCRAAERPIEPCAPRVSQRPREHVLRDNGEAQQPAPLHQDIESGHDGGQTRGTLPIAAAVRARWSCHSVAAGGGRLVHQCDHLFEVR